MSATKAVLITGCSSGIGRATALRLVRAGPRHRWTVWASARNPAALSELEAAGCRAVALDVDDEQSIGRAVDRIEAAHGAIDVLVAELLENWRRLRLKQPPVRIAPLE